MSTIPYRYDIEGFAKELEVEFRTLVDLYREYFNEMKSEITEAKRFADSSDWVMLERTVHNIKGISANLVINDIYEEAKTLDTCLKSNMTENAAAFITQIENLLFQAEIEVKRIFTNKELEL